MDNEPNTANQPPLKLRGFREPAPAESGLKSKFVRVKAEFRTGRARSAQQAETISVNNDDVVEIEFADGPRLWLRGDDYRQQFCWCSFARCNGRRVQPVPTASICCPVECRAGDPSNGQ